MPNWKKVIVSGSDAILSSITSSAGILSNGNLTVEGSLTASLLSGYAWVGGPGGINTQIPTSSFAGSVTITNDLSNRVLTSNGDGTLNAESDLTYNGALFSVGPSVLATTNVGRAFYLVDTAGYNYLNMGDVNQAGNATRLEISDQLGKINFHVGNPDPHYFDSELLFVSGAISSSDLYVNNKFNSTAIFTGPLVTQTNFTTPAITTTVLTGSFISNNGNDRVVTSNGDGQFTAESGLRFTINGFYVEKDTNIDGDLSVTGNITAQQYIVSSSVTYITQSFSSGSTIFGDSLDDTHQFTGSVDITGSLSLDYLILNPNTTTTGSNDTETQINISLGDEEYKRGVIKRVFDWRENLTSASDIDINNQVIADVGEFNRGEFRINIDIKGRRNPTSPSIFYLKTGSISQNLPIYPNNFFIDNVNLEIYFELGDTFGSNILNIHDITNTPLVKYENNQLKFNFVNPTNANNLLSSSLMEVLLDYQLYK